MFEKSKFKGIQDAINDGIVSKDDIFLKGMFRQTVGQTLLKSSLGSAGWELSNLAKLDGKFVVFAVQESKIIIFVGSPRAFYGAKYKSGHFFTVIKDNILHLEVIKKSSKLILKSSL